MVPETIQSEPAPEIKCTEEICIEIATKADGKVLLTNLLPTLCKYEVLVNPGTKYLLVVNNITKSWQLLDNKELLAENATLFGEYTTIAPDITIFVVSTCYPEA